MKKHDTSAKAKWTSEQVAEFKKDDAPELTDEWFAAASVNNTGKPLPRESIHLKVPPSVLEYFRAEGPGYQTRINNVLAAYVQVARKRASTKR